MQQSRLLWFGFGLLACEAQPSPAPAPITHTESAAEAPSTSTTAPSTATPSGQGSAPTSTSPASSPPPSSSTGAPPECPDGMHFVQGGTYWAGAAEPGGTTDEHPRHQTKVHSFCMDRTEVTTAAYEACVAEGKCQSAKRDTSTCNSGRRENHPINCVSWEQAKAFCAARGARLPSELEWEYAARGGAEQRTYTWGNDPPDGNTCWKSARSCEVATHREGAFGLHDMNGNLWEWTSTWYAPYPWPAKDGHAKIYRGGSWSRRFEKWLSLSLRNRQAPHEFGSHLGFRCAALPAEATCPYGREEDGCRYGVETAECPNGETWNGVRCAKAGETGCRDGQTLVEGHGCSGGSSFATAARAASRPEESTPVTARPEPRFDADCQRYQPARPKAMRFEGGSHAARTAAGNARGCKNRDVGVGWNSACCP